MHRILLTLLFVIVFLQGAISEYLLGASYATGVVGDSPIGRFIVETAVVINFGWMLVTRKVKLPPGCIWFTLYVSWSLLSGIVTQDTLYDGFLYARYTLYSMLIYIVAYSSNIHVAQLKRFAFPIASLMILQLAVSVIKVTVFGDRTEWRVGTMTVIGGELAALFPLVALAYAMAYYAYVRHSFWVLLLGLAFGMVGYASGKRAIYFTLPLCFLASLSLYALVQYRCKRPVPHKILIHSVAAIAISIPFFLYGVAHSAGIGMENASGLTIAESLINAATYAESYNTGVSDRGMSTGRTSTSWRVINSLVAGDAKQIIFGWGPTALIPKRGEGVGTAGGFRALGIWYGIVGWSRDVLSIGIIGPLLYSVAYLSVLGYSYRALYITADRWIKAALFAVVAGVATLLAAYAYYASSFMSSGTITFLLLFTAGVALSNCERPIGMGMATRSEKRNAGRVECRALSPALQHLAFK